MTHTAPHHDDELPRLISALLDGSITAQGHTRLAELLRADPDARAAYHDAVDLHSILRWRHAPHTPARLASASRTRDPRLALMRPAATYALAASLALAAAALAVYLFAFNSKPETSNPKPAVSAPIATVIDADDDTTLIFNDTVVSPGDSIAAGRFAIESGSAELQIDSGATVRLRGNTRLVVHDPMSASLTRGSATFHCPPRAIGYTVHLFDGVRVVDLGTAFTVDVDDAGNARVFVDNGRVRLIVDAHGQTPQRSIDLDQATAVTLADRGRSISRLIAPLRPDSYVYVGELRPDTVPDTAKRADPDNSRLTDGVTGTARFDDGSWVGVLDPAADTARPQPAVRFDLGRDRVVSAVTVSYLVNTPIAVYPPTHAVVRFGPTPDDLTDSVTELDLEADAVAERSAVPGAAVHHRTIRFAPRSARFLQLELFNAREWTYISEVTVHAEIETPGSPAAPPDAAVPASPAAENGQTPGLTPAGSRAAP